MRIGLVRRGYSATGGAERYLLRFAAGLRACGHEPVLAAGADWPNEAWPHGSIHRIPGRNPQMFSQALGAAREALGCDVVFSLERVVGCDVYRAGDGVHASWLMRREAVDGWWKARFRALQPKHRMLMRLERELFADPRTRVVVNSRMVAREIHEYFGTPEKQMALVYNGYDLPHEIADSPQRREETRKSLGVPAGATMALFTGSGWERKGLRDAVAALRRLGRGDLHLVVAGSGKMRAAYRHGNVHFPGPVGDVGPLCHAADFFVLPTWYDPFSNACLEAARHGLPVVTTTANGFAEWIEAGISGHAVEAGNVDELAAAIEYWAADGRAPTARAHCAAGVDRLTVDENVRATIAAVLGDSHHGAHHE